jgi:hypothetical protein
MGVPSLHPSQEALVRLPLQLGVFGLLCSLGLSASAPDPIAYPENFRKWTHVKSGASAARGGVHHIFANDKAMQGYRTGKFPDGAVIVFDLIATKDPAALPMDGPRTLVDVMVKDGAKYAASGGWGFEEFNGDSRTERALTDETRAACFTCHVKQKDTDYVFSQLKK